ncbi:unnamed protein product [Boreogadus saida]
MKSLQKITLKVPFCENLDLFENLLEDVNETQTTDLELVNVLPDLCNVTGDPFRNLRTMPLQTHQMKYLESLDLSFNSIVLDKPCFWPTHITSLSLSNNNLGNKVFSFLSQYFQRIDLSKTGITGLTQEDLSQFPMLTHLFLSSNSIKVIPTDLSPTLVSLYIDQNSITSVSRESLAGLPSLRTLKAGDNPFVCSCDSYWFINTLNKSLLPDWPLDYTCSTPPSVADLPMSEYRTSRMSCEAWLQAAVALPVTMLIVLALCSAFYACDGVWYTKMLWVWIRVKRRGQKQANLLNNTTFRYHSFISYSHQDSAWVESKLVPSLEGAGLSLCIHERDFVPGQWIVDNIINCVEASYKTLFVLSNHFVQSEWCNYELFFAQHRAIDAQQDSLVFILLEPIPTNSLPKKFLKLRRLLMQQTYLEWPMDERKQQVFWVNLRSMLQVADHRILKDMALELAQSASLIPDDLVPLLK